MSKERTSCYSACPRWSEVDDGDDDDEHGDDDEDDADDHGDDDDDDDLVALANMI